MTDSTAETKHAGNGKVYQLVQTIMVAVLLALCGWIGKTVLKNREDIITLETETKAKEKEYKASIDAQQETEKEILRVLQEIRDTRKP